MVDSESRRKLAEVTRHFAAGLITAEEWEERSLAIHDESRVRDEGWWQIWWTIWTLYDDIRTDYLRGEWALTDEARAGVARCLLFLYSSEEYEWFDASPYFGVFNFLTLGWWGRKRERESAGDVNCYPFFRKAQLDEARRTPRLLTGTA